MNRRQYLQVSSAAVASAFIARGESLAVKTAQGRVVGVSGNAESVELTRKWSGDVCRSSISNRAKQPIAVKEVVLFAIPHSLPGETKLYGESFQMLSQTAGTLASPVDLGYVERKHYKLPQPEGVTALSGLVTLTPPSGDTVLLGYTSCKRFNGRFYLRPESIEVVIDTEGLQLAPGQTWELEEFTFLTGPNRAALLAKFADQIARNHPPLRATTPPTGWCSWYCFGPRVTAKNVIDNLDVIAKDIPSLRYIQIDDGYQPAMGDWLETGQAFGGDIKGVLQEIRKRKFEPAIWVAPFIAEE
jgi:alpha-galactosidase